MQTRFKKKLVPLSLAIIFCSILLFTLDDYAITHDEDIYFLSGPVYFEWLKNPSIETIDQYWSYEATKNEHPPLSPFLGEITKYLLHKKLNLLDSISAFRISALLFVFFLTLILYSFSSKLYGRKIAFIISLSFFFLPRIFFHSHLSTLDYPVTALWLLVVYAYWRGIKDQKWIFYSSILLGFALLIKLNAYFLYIPIIFYWTLSFNQKLKCLVFRKCRLSLQENMHMFSKIIPMFTISPAIFIAFWPHLWKNPILRILEYPQFSLKLLPEQSVYYLGEVLTSLPWHYPLVLTLITVPLITLIPFFIGLFKISKKPHRNTHIFILFNSLLPLFIISLPGIHKYDGVRLFMPAFPFICMISGLGIKYIFTLLKKFNLENVFFLVFLLLFSLSTYNSVIKYHPYQSSYYNEVIGGIDGAADKGFEVTYWGDAFIGTLPFLDEHSDSTFWIVNHPVPYRSGGKVVFLKENYKFGNRSNSDYLAVLIRKGHLTEEMWGYYKHVEPVFSVRISKTDLVNIYKLK